MIARILQSGSARTVMIIGFFLTLFLVESNFCGSKGVARYNKGYGTFDMKKYDYETVTRVLNQYEPGGREAAYRYYLTDFTFIVFFAAIQLMLIDFVYSNTKIYQVIFIYLMLIAVPIVRGIFDLLENILLVITISGLWDVNRLIVTVASICTRCKLMCIGGWSILMLLGIAYRVINLIYSLMKEWRI